MQVTYETITLTQDFWFGIACGVILGIILTVVTIVMIDAARRRKDI